jgi:serine/threonine protein kinase
LGFFEEGGYLYLVQEYIAGETIDRELQRSGPFSEAKLLAFLRDLLPVLQFVHDRSTIHRDLKPLNLIRRQRDQRIVPIDFGVAKVLEANTQSRPGTKIGTAGYAPDEQLRGGQAYPASDLYSVGAICVFLLTGVEPEELYNPLTGQWPWREQLAQWRDELSGNGDSLDASQRKHLPVSDSVSEGLGLVLDRLLQPAVADRYQSALEVLADLDNIIRTMPPSPYRREESMAVDRDRAKRFWLTRIGTSSGGNFS